MTSGKSFTAEVDAYDNFGNLATSFDGSVTVGLANGSAGNLSGTLTMTATNGVAQFNNLVTTQWDDLPRRLQWHAGEYPFQQRYGEPGACPAQLVIQTQPSQTAAAGQAFAIQPVIWEEDQYGNLETSDSTTVVTAYLASGTGPLQGSVSRPLSSAAWPRSPVCPTIRPKPSP